MTPARSPYRTSRRLFLGSLAAAGAGAALSARSFARAAGSNERLRVASIGTGGKGWSDLTEVAKSPQVEIVALVNVDDGPKHMGQAAETFPQAKRYTDWRRLFDEAGTFDAVIVSTPDHMHAPITLPALELRKHVYCQKPLTHTVFEARQVRQAAERAGVVTQMGNQIHSHGFYRTAVKLIKDGAIGKAVEVFSWQSGKMGWLLESDRPAGADPIPAGLHWDNWLGVAAERPYKDKIYHPFNWRGWQDYSTGQLGDFGCHIFDPVFTALELTAPTTVQADAPTLNREVWNDRSTVRFDFPATKYTAGPITLTWYDGAGAMPPREKLGVSAEFKLPKAGSLVRGEKGSLLIPHVAAPRLLPTEQFANYEMPKLESLDHYVGWADACRGEGKTTDHFSYAGPLTEAVILGAIAVRVPHETLNWDAAALRITNNTTASALLTKEYRKGWEPKWS